MIRSDRATLIAFSTAVTACSAAGPETATNDGQPLGTSGATFVPGAAGTSAATSTGVGAATGGGSGSTPVSVGTAGAGSGGVGGGVAGTLGGAGTVSGGGSMQTGASGMPGFGNGGSSGATAMSGAGGIGAAGQAGTAGNGAAGMGSDQGGERLEGVSENFSFFVTSYYHIKELSGSDDGFGGDLRYNGAATGLEGADAICQEMASRVGFGNRTWRAYLSTSGQNAIDRIGTGPWYDFVGNLVAENVQGLLVENAGMSFGGPGGGFGGDFGGGGGGGLGLDGGCVEGDTDRPAGGAMDCGTYDELGTYHDGSTDQNNDGINDDDHDTMTATNADGTYAGFDCEGWTSVTAAPEGGGGGGFLSGGIMMGHSWPAASGTHWSEAHGGHACAAGTNFIQDGAGDSSTVGGGGGYGGFYCFALNQ